MLALDRGALTLLGRIGEGRAALEIAFDPFPGGKLGDELNPGKARVGVHGRPVLPVAPAHFAAGRLLQRALTLAVVQPVTPDPTRRASSTTTRTPSTRTPSRFSKSAVVRPVMPPPSTATSQSRSPSSLA